MEEFCKLAPSLHTEKLSRTACKHLAMRVQVSISTPYNMEHNPMLADKQRNLFNYLLLAYLVGLPLATIIFINQYSMVTYEMPCVSVISNAYGTQKSLYSAATIGFLVIANLERHHSAMLHCPVQTEQTAAMAALYKPLHREFEYLQPLHELEDSPYHALWADNI